MEPHRHLRASERPIDFGETNGLRSENGGGSRP